MFDIKEYLSKETPKEISNFILGKKKRCDYRNDFYNYEKLGKDIIKNTGIDSIYTKRVLKIILDNNKIHFSDIIIYNFKWDKKGIELLIKTVEEIGLSLKELVSLLNIHPNFKNVASRFFEYLHHRDKKLLKKIFRETKDSDIFIHMIPYLLKLDYGFYNKSVKKHLVENLTALLNFNTSYLYNTRLYHFLGGLQDDAFKEKFILVYLSRWIKRPLLDSREVILTKDMRYSILKFIKLGYKDKHFVNAISILSKKKDLKQFSVFFLPNLKMTPFDKRIFLLSIEIDLFAYYNLLPKGRVTHFNELLNEYDKESLLEAIQLIPNSQQTLALEKLFGFNKKIAYQFLLKIIATAKSKGLKLEIINQATNYYSENPEVKNDFIKLQKSKNSSIREIAIKVLLNVQEDEKDMDRIIQFLDTEENTKIGRVVSNFLDKEEVSFADFRGSTTLNTLLYSKEWFIFNSKKSKKPNIEWLDFSALPKLYYIDDDFIINLKEFYQFIELATTIKDFSNIMILEKYGMLLRKKELVEFSVEMYKYWDKTTKRKWVLSFIATFGDDSVIDMLEKDIFKLLENKETSIAVKLIEVVARIATPKALKLLNLLSKSNIKLVRKETLDSLDIAAKKLEIFKDELLDEFIPDLGFNSDSFIDLKIKERVFKLQINLDLLITIIEGEKELKKMPIGTNPTESTKKAMEQYKNLKSNLKKEYEKQIKRLENALVQKRLWSPKNWKKVFIENPIMNQLGKTVIWEVHDKELELYTSFRVLPNNELINIDNIKVDFNENCEIYLAHPIELKIDETEKWLEILNKDNIKQPFEQLKRRVFYLDFQKNGYHKFIDFENTILVKDKLSNIFNKNGWMKRNIKAGDCKYSSYKKLEYYQIGVAVYYGEKCENCSYHKLNQIPLSKVVFYTVKKNQKYDLNDQVIENQYIILSKLPKRVHSEISLEINEIIESLNVFKELNFDMIIE